MYQSCLDTLESQPVFDPDFHTELIIKDETEDSGNQKYYILNNKLKLIKKIYDKQIKSNQIKSKLENPTISYCRGYIFCE